MRLTVWAAIDTRDPYKRLCAVADTARELADMLGIKAESIYEHRAKTRKGVLPEKYVRIEIPDDKEETAALCSSVDLASDYNCTVPEKDWMAYQAVVMKREQK